MGQTSSVQEGNGQSSADLDSEEKPVSGFIITPELQGAIIREFQSQILQEEWDKFRTSVLVRRNARGVEMNETLIALEQRRQQSAEVSAKNHAVLDQSIDELNARFSDISIELEYNAADLVQRFDAFESEGDHNRQDETKKSLPCLGQRAHWIDCHKKYSTDPRPCNTYLEELEKCVSSTVTK